MHIDNVAIIGVGLLGGSLGLKIKEVYPDAHIAGFGSSHESLLTAQKQECIDSVHSEYSACTQADLIIIATPVKAIKSVVEQLKPYINSQFIIDVGSTKLKVIEDVNEVLSEYPRFIPCHPIAGKEASGSIAAEKELFTDKKLIICKESYHTGADIERIYKFWQKIGALVEVMDAHTHDAIFSLTSHVPHLVAFGYINMMADNEKSFAYTGGGLKDFARIAASNPKMWADITLDNKANISKDLSAFITELETLKKTIDTDNYAQLLEYFTNSNTHYTKIT